jgi:aspartate/glutamate racemase
MPSMKRLPDNPLPLFEAYMRLCGTPSLSAEPGELSGRTLGIVNGSSWVTLWSMYFGRKYLPGAKLVNVGNEALQLNFMDAHHAGRPCPPESNIRCFREYAEDIVELYRPDAILLTCSTMNRAAETVRQAVADRGIPLVQIDEAMMEAAVRHGGKTLVVATHGPTVASTQALLRETAGRLGCGVEFAGTTVEEAFELLGEGRIAEHNEIIARAIEQAQARERIDSVVLAQLSMAVFSLSYPDASARFGVPVFNSGDCGFQRVREILLGTRPVDTVTRAPLAASS